MWRVARSLDVLLGEINAAAPNRSKVSDGGIGDAAHATRDSDHNPWVTLGGQGIVRARDFTHDPNGGLDCNRLADRLAAILAAGSHPAARSGAYVIWNRRIFSFDRRGEGWRTYSGSNTHEHHCHLSVATDPGGFDNTQPWGVMAQARTAPSPEEDDMALDAKLYPKQDDSQTVGGVLRRLDRFITRADARDKQLREQVATLRKAVDANASPAEVKDIVRNIEATIVLEVAEEEK